MLLSMRIILEGLTVVVEDAVIVDSVAIVRGADLLALE